MSLQSLILAHVDPSRLALAACVLVANLLWVICILPPNPQAESQARNDVKDHLHISILSFASLRFTTWLAFAFVAVLHGVLVYTYPSPPRAVCPQPTFATLADPTLFTWNPKLAAVLLIIAAAAAVRIAAFRNLGVNFTFNLKQPSGLVTTGVHRYMQHPSYTGAIPIICCILWMYVKSDGLATCYLPGTWVQSLSKLQPFFVAIMVVILGVGASTRVTDEEAMLKRTFGKEWEAYHRKTKRFIPGIF